MRHEFTESQKTHLLEWAKELETTDLQQGRGGLRTEDTFCPLGIYCHMKDPQGWFHLSFSPPHYRWGREGRQSTLPASLVQELGIESLQVVFMAMNDWWGYSFQQVAQEIHLLVEVGEFSQDTKDNMTNHWLEKK